MNTKQLRTLAAAFVALILMAFAGSATAAHQDEMKTGKKAEIVLYNTTHVGDVVLPPGHYTFQHVVSEGQHYATFVGPKGTKTAIREQVKCTNEPLKETVKQTAITLETASGVDRITRIEIKGEDVAHIFS
ncbi:MAG TPA: hypothetical protein VMH00_09845 [Candidatus Limnocylindrales bacterium]|nr:hypothetical protein [Candidatus Limnocylindrales bacterium]